jgi:hypothetical protein
VGIGLTGRRSALAAGFAAMRQGRLIALLAL